MARTVRWSEYVIAVYGPDGRVVTVHDCRETVTAQGKPACQDDSNRCAVWETRGARWCFHHHRAGSPEVCNHHRAWRTNRTDRIGAPA